MLGHLKLGTLGGANYQFDLSANTTFSGTGLLEFWSGTVTVPDNFSVNVPLARQFEGFVITGAGDVTIGGYFDYRKGLWDGFGRMVVTPGGKLDITYSDFGPVAIKRGIVNGGSVSISTSMELGFQADIINTPVGTLKFNNVVMSNAGGTVFNYGMVEYKETLADRFMRLPVINSGGTWINTGQFANLGEVTITENGLFNMGGAQIALDGSMTINGGTLLGGGSLTALTVANLGGTIQVGDPALGGQFSTLTINADLQQSGTLELRLGSDGQNDRLVVNGHVTLSGQLVLGAGDGFVPQSGFSWTLLESTEPISGTFASINAPPGIVIDYSADPKKVIARFI